MEYRYDAEVDILVIRLRRDRIDHGDMEKNIITHFNKKGQAVEIEILDAKKTVKDLEMIIQKAA